MKAVASESKFNPLPYALTPSEYADALKQGGLWIGVVQITHELAEVIKKGNVENRSLAKRGLSKVEQDIGFGRFEFNGESIIVSDDGKLNDGQHRIEGVIATHIPIVSVLVIGVGRDTRFTVDQGTPRNVASRMKMRGDNHHNIRAAVARFMTGFEGSDYATFDSRSDSHTQIIHIHDSLSGAIDAGIDFAMAFGKDDYTTSNLTPTIVATMHAAMVPLLDKDTGKVEQYLTELVEGVNLAKEDWSYRVRTTIAGMVAHGNGSTTGRAERRMEVIMRGWVFMVRGLKNGVLYPTTGKGKDKKPVTGLPELIDADGERVYKVSVKEPTDAEVERQIKQEQANEGLAPDEIAAQEPQKPARKPRAKKVAEPA